MTWWVPWAPEIEYAFRDGYAVELELDIGPLDISGAGATDIGATEIQGYKIAFQRTLGTALDQQLIYGWQAINTYEVERKAVGMDALLIVGYRVNPQWSIVAMNGIRHTDVTGGGRVIGLMNFSVFHKPSARMTLGLEADFELPKKDQRGVLLMPQLHLKTSAKTTVQFGVGIESLERGSYHPVLGMRLWSARSQNVTHPLDNDCVGLRLLAGTPNAGYQDFVIHCAFRLWLRQSMHPWNAVRRPRCYSLRPRPVLPQPCAAQA